MSVTDRRPTTVRGLSEYVEAEHPELTPDYDASRDQLLIVGQPGNPEASAALREVLATQRFAIQDEQATGRARWVAIVNAGAEADR